jgi:ferredoxin
LAINGTPEAICKIRRPQNRLFGGANRDHASPRPRQRAKGRPEKTELPDPRQINEIMPEKCTGCGECLDYCPAPGALRQLEA